MKKEVKPSPDIQPIPQPDQQTNQHDLAAMYIAKKLVDIPQDNLYRQGAKASNFQTFGHQFEPDGTWKFWIVEDRMEDDNTTSLYLREIIKDGSRFKIGFDRPLFK